VRQSMIGIVDLQLVGGREIRVEHDQIRAAGVAQRRKQETAEALDQERVRERPGRRRFQLDAGQLAPVAIPSRRPSGGIIAGREIGNRAERNEVSGEGRRWRNRRALSVLLERGLRCTRKIQRFDARPIETAAVDCRARAAQGGRTPI